ncbi:iron-containing alcohol dehydrogenase [Cytobacillus gottheilii]|uniref:iron-containing alcohol dehydrogenase n=1 Tax=Cytobacillus gottheilii TaxID=859144 RepID=UPI003CE9AF6D
MGFQLTIPANLYGGSGSLHELSNILKKESARKVIVYTDKGIRNAGLVDELCEVLEETGVEFNVYDDIKPEPSYIEVEKIQEETKNAQADLIIGFGGGSVMDAAKLCSVLIGASYSVKDLLDTPQIAAKKIKTIMIPTTCGTGSEATCNAIVAVPEEKVKKGIVNNEMIPDYVILDPQLIRNLPKQIIAATGVDALAHAVECYTSNKATPFSNVYALEGAKLIFENIRQAYNEPENMKAKEAMLIGAFYGGVAITGSGTTAVHALSYPLGGKYHIPHGVSNAILFETVMNFNKDACADQLADICDAINPSYSDKSVNEKAQYVIDEIADIVKVTNIPVNLNEFGIQKDDLEFLVQAGSEQKRLLVNNKKELSKEDIRQIYSKVIG